MNEIGIAKYGYTVTLLGTDTSQKGMDVSQQMLQRGHTEYRKKYLDYLKRGQLAIAQLRTGNNSVWDLDSSIGNGDNSKKFEIPVAHWRTEIA